MATERVVNVTQPGPATLTCTAIARPQPSITWYRIRTTYDLLSEGELGVSIAVENGDNDRTTNSVLQFYPTSPYFSAVYVCEATNQVSSVEMNISLIVYGKKKHLYNNVLERRTASHLFN